MSFFSSYLTALVASFHPVWWIFPAFFLFFHATFGVSLHPFTIIRETLVFLLLLSSWVSFIYCLFAYTDIAFQAWHAFSTSLLPAHIIMPSFLAPEKELDCNYIRVSSSTGRGESVCVYRTHNRQ